MAPIQAEIKLVELKNCFVNVPRSIVTLLDNAKAVSSTVVLLGSPAYKLLGRPERRRRATIQGIFLECTSYEKTQWRFTTLCIRWMDRNGKHSKADVNYGQKWKKTKRRDGRGGN